MLIELFSSVRVDILVPLFSPIIVLFIQSNSMRNKFQLNPFKSLMLLSLCLLLGWQAGAVYYHVTGTSNLIQSSNPFIGFIAKNYWLSSYVLYYSVLFFLFKGLFGKPLISLGFPHKRLAVECSLVFTLVVSLSIFYRTIKIRFDSDVLLSATALIIVVLYLNWTWSSLNPVAYFRVYMSYLEQPFEFYDFIKQEDVYHFIELKSSDKTTVNGLTVKVQDVTKIEHIYYEDENLDKLIDIFVRKR